ncbi:MAG: FG-GAP-like repeat-containing protein [Anaerolineae bacterium]
MSRRWLLILVSLSIILLIGGILLFGRQGQTGEESKATLTVLQSPVWVQRGSTGPFEEIEEQRSWVSKGDRIRTGDEGEALLTFLEGTDTEIKPKTELTVKGLRIPPEGQPFTIVLFLWIGETWNRVIKLVDPASRHEIETPSAVVTVRDTEYGVGVDPKQVTRVQVVEGVVAVTAQQVTVEVKAGEETTVQPEQPPEPPRPIQKESPVTFTDVAASAGVADSKATWTGSWGDYTGDGYLDLFVANWSPEPQVAANNLYRNNGDGTFTDVAAQLGVATSRGTMRGVFADYDNDGDLDLYVTQAGPPSVLYRNNGDGTFSDVTREAGLEDFRPCSMALFADFDNDGYLDLYLIGGLGPNIRGPNRYYRNNGDGTFSDVTAQAGLSHEGAGHDAAVGDYDNDGDPDLLLVNLDSPGILYRNNGDGTFNDVTAGSGLTLPSGTAAAFGDYDNDGDLDLFALPERPALLFRNNGDGTFSDVTVQAEVGDVAGFDVAWTDLDNDGFLDLVLGRPDGENVFLLNNGDGTFSDVSATAGIRDAQPGFGVAPADFDGDGDLDLYLANGGFIGAAANSLYQNSGTDNHWLAVRLVGTVSNSHGVGAKVNLRLEGGPSQMQEIGGGTGLCQPPLLTHFGLGEVSRVDELSVQWPSGIVQTLTDVPADQLLTVTEETK